MTRLLITGATGFIGEPVMRAACEHFEVHAVARTRAGLRRTTRENVIFHSCDLLNAYDSVHLIEGIRPTHLLHLAWIAKPGVYSSSPENYRWVEASKQLLLAFARCGGRRAVISGSCAEYDWNTAKVCHETHTPTRPYTPYGKCKLALNQWATTFGQARGVQVAWARLFWMYGPRESPVRLVPSVARSLLTGVPAVCSAGTQIRDFLHVNDVADALVTLTQGELTGCINIGSGDPAAVRNVIEIVVRECGRPDLVRLGESETPTREPAFLVADVNRLRNELGWRPRMDLASGLRETVKWWRNAKPQAA